VESPSRTHRCAIAIVSRRYERHRRLRLEVVGAVDSKVRHGAVSAIAADGSEPKGTDAERGQAILSCLRASWHEA
jgi:hypothetical protein